MLLLLLLLRCCFSNHQQPFLALSAEELSRTLPLLSEVPVETLKVALPLIAKQDIAVIRKMIKFLKLVRAAESA